MKIAGILWIKRKLFQVLKLQNRNPSAGPYRIWWMRKKTAELIVYLLSRVENPQRAIRLIYTQIFPLEPSSGNYGSIVSQNVFIVVHFLPGRHMSLLKWEIYKLPLYIKSLLETVLSPSGMEIHHSATPLQLTAYTKIYMSQDEQEWFTVHFFWKTRNQEYLLKRVGTWADMTAASASRKHQPKAHR